MMRDKGGGGGGQADNPASSSRSARSNPSNTADYYGLTGWQSHSPSSRLDLDPLPARMLASVSPLSKSPFSSASVSRRSGLSPDRTFTALPAGMESSMDRDSAVYDRSSLASGYRGPADLLYNGEQSHHPLPVSAYPGNKEDASFFGLAAADSSGGGLYGRSVLENTLFNRGLAMTPLPNNPALVPSYRSHIPSSGEDFVMDRSLDRKFVFGSGHAPGALLPPHAYNRLLDNYSHAAEHISSAVKTSMDTSSAERSGTPYSSPLPSHIPFHTAPNYASRNSALYPFGHFSSSLPPDSYTPYTSSLTHLSSYGQLSAPPPAHTRVHEALVQRSTGGLTEGESKQTGEGSLGQPFDATVSSRDYANPGGQWHSASLTSPKPENDIVPFESQAPSANTSLSDRQGDRYNPQSLPYAKDSDTLDQLMGDQFVAVGSQEKIVTAQNPSCAQTSRHNPCQVETSWTEADLRYMQSSTASSSVSSTDCARSCQASVGHVGSTMDVTASCRSVQHQRIDDRGSSSFVSAPNPVSFPPKPTSAVSSGKHRLHPSCSRNNNSTSLQFPNPPGLCSDSESDTNAEVKGKVRQQISQVGVGKGGSHNFNKTFVSVASATDGLHGASSAFLANNKSTLQEFSACAEAKTQSPVKLGKNGSSLGNMAEEDPLQYDSSTSEYEPPSPYQVSTTSHKQGRKPQKTQRRRTITTPQVDDSDDADIDQHPPKIKMTIKTERVVSTLKPKKTVTRREKRGMGGPVTKAKPGMKKTNRTCPLCLKTFSRADSLTCHMRVHTGDRPYQCDQCAASYKVSSHLRDHIRSKHSDAKPFQCEKCGKPFTYSTARRRHEKICGKDLAERVEYQCANCYKGFVTAKGFSKHQEKCGSNKCSDGVLRNDDLTFKCSHCRKVFDSFASLDGHQRFFCSKRPEIGQYSCSDCGKTFFKRNLYIIHTRRHTGERPFRCVQCDACFYDKSSLKRHMETHEGNKKFQCSLCDAAFYLKRCLSLHITRIHCGLKAYRCRQCPSHFSSGYQLSHHIRHLHRRERSFRCTLCGKGFYEASTCLRHMRQHAVQPVRPVRRRTVKHHACKVCGKSVSMKELHPHVLSEHPGVPLDDAISKQPPRCDVCSRDFSCPESLHVHKLQHTGKKPFKCKQCGMAFFLKAVLLLHQQKHTDYRPHFCCKCGESFRWRTALSQHLMIQHSRKTDKDLEGGKRFSCHVCGKGFKRQICLNVHLKRHRTVMPNICSQCGKGFVDLCHLKIHMAKHDGPKPYTCELCSAGFYYQYLLDDHMKKKHMELSKQSWLCEECGKSLCRRDSLLKHMALHEKYRNGQIPKSGRRKGAASVSTEVPASDPVPTSGGRKRGRPKGWRKTTDGQQKVTVSSAPGCGDPVNRGMCGSVACANPQEPAEADLVELTPAVLPPAFAEPPNHAAPPNLAPPPSLAAPSGLGTPTNFSAPTNLNAPTNLSAPANLGASPSFGAPPSFGAAPCFGASPSFGAPPSFGMQQPVQEQQYNYPYHYNTYIHHNIPCPTVADN